ncbi:transcriptional regulator, partial [Escherichia coli]|nr:transcriptional regulator [Escherichia coli]
MVKDITYGIPTEVWPRDYEHAENILMFWRKNNIPVRVTLEDGQVFCMCVQGTMPSRNKLDLCPLPY